MSVRLLAAALALLAASARAEDDPPVRLSLPTESERAMWKSPGFRVALGLGYGWFEGLDGAPSGRLLGPMLRAGFRLDDRWSLMGSVQYLSAAGSDEGLSGLRFAGVVEPTFHATERLSLAVGFGFGGIVEGQLSRDSPDPQPGTLADSYTFPDASTPLPECDGVGVAGRVRADYLFILGPRASTGVALELDGQWTACVDDTGRVEPDTGQAIVRRQWWPHAGATLALGVTWR